MLLATFWNLVYSVGIGLVIASLLFMKKIGDATSSQSVLKAMPEDESLDEEEFTDIDGNDGADIAIKQIMGPLFFWINRWFPKIGQKNSRLGKN